MNRCFQTAALCFIGMGNAVAGLSISNDQFVIDGQDLNIGYILYEDTANNLKPWFKIKAAIKDGATELANVTLPQSYRLTGSTTVPLALSSTIPNNTSEVTVTLTAENVYWAWCHIDNDVSKGVKPEHTQVGNETPECFARVEAMVRVPRITESSFDVQIESNATASISYSAQAPLDSYVKFTLLDLDDNYNNVLNTNGNIVIQYFNLSTEIEGSFTVTIPEVTVGNQYEWRAKLFASSENGSLITGPFGTGVATAISSNTPPALASNIQSSINRTEAIVFDDLFLDADGDTLQYSDVNVVFGNWHDGPPPEIWFGKVDSGKTHLRIYQEAFGNKLNQVVDFMLRVTASDQTTSITKSILFQIQPIAGERIWFYPNRKGGGESIAINKMNSHTHADSSKLFYGIRYELPWSQFETSPGIYDFTELDLLMTNAAASGYKAYLVLHDKTWVDSQHNDWPIPLSTALANQETIDVFPFTIAGVPKEIFKKQGEEYYVSDRWNVGNKLRVANRWLKNSNGDYVIVERYKNAVQAILDRKAELEGEVNPDYSYSQLEVISIGESSTLDNPNISDEAMNSLGYPGASDYAGIQVKLMEGLSSLVQSTPVKIALNLNWIARQDTPTGQDKWLQHDILTSVESLINTVQAVEDVHTLAANPNTHYHDRVYAYTSGADRIMSKYRVWAHLSCNTKDNGGSALENLTKSQDLASNIVLRDSCTDTTSTLQQYINLLIN